MIDRVSLSDNTGVDRAEVDFSESHDSASS